MDIEYQIVLEDMNMQDSNDKREYNQKQAIRILVVDDEVSITEFIKMGLISEGYDVRVAYEGVEAVNLGKTFLPHVIVLDLMLPGVSGFEVCQILKKEIVTSVIMLTAREEIDDRVKGLMIGADDYMVKPFSYRELSARIHARIRNTFSELTENQDIGLFRIENGAHEIYYRNEKLDLAVTEYALLEFLLLNQGLVVSKKIILDKVWSYDFYGDDNIVEVYIRYLRQKLGDKQHKIIQTIRGVGYKVNIYEN